MSNYVITAECIAAYADHLRREERSEATLEKYLRAVQRFSLWAAGRAVTKDLTAAWKEHLRAQGYAPATINGMLAAVHSLFAAQGWTGCAVRYLRVQRRLFSATERELSAEEYGRLVACALEREDHRLALLLETMAATGIRVSEVRFITLEAARAGQAEIALKGKIRTILLPGKLCRKLRKYARAQGIAAGQLFLTRRGRPMDRKAIWAQMKRLCRWAGVDGSKVFPHNLRRLFARSFYRVQRDLVKLADVLGHSSVETTRLYLRSTGAEHRAVLARMGLVT